MEHTMHGVLYNMQNYTVDVWKRKILKFKMQTSKNTIYSEVGRDWECGKS